MIDTDSTHSLISPIIMKLLDLPTVLFDPLIVVTTSGMKLITTQLCVQLIFYLQHHHFTAQNRWATSASFSSSPSYS
jgi:hypothetical protein